jgi:transcription antitermination factor NusG
MKPMPILSAEPTHFPEGLLTDPDIFDARPGRWWAVYTRSKAEKALARHLQSRSVAHYLPLQRNTWRKEGRTFTSFLPLFPGYVFLRGDEEDRVTALESNLISRILEVPDQERLFSDLRRVDRVLGADVEVGRSDVLAVGQPVDIVAGPFEGLRGVLLRRGNQMRLVVEVAFLRQAVSVEVEGWMVEPVSSQSMATSAN